MTGVPLVIGLPCHRREWCLDRWFDSLAAQDVPEKTLLLFALSEPGDPSERIIIRRSKELGLDHWIFYAEGLPCFGEDQKDDPRRYAVLAHIRNQLLRRLLTIQPHYYLSWDSDIILEPGAFAAMRHLVENRQLHRVAAGALVDMGGNVYPGNWSWMSLSGQDAFRHPNQAITAAEQRYPFRADVIMGVKLMTPAAYSDVRYADHVLGEDVGWAIQAREMGIERWVCPAARGTHLYRIV
jgi:hypothetical protein